jgi:heme exporter protein C
MQKHWWKILSLILLLGSIFFGLTTRIPKTGIEESLRNVFYHVPMWFSMIIMFTISFVYAIMYLNTNKLRYELISHSFAVIGVLLGILGLLTGMIWARIAWGSYWNNDPKQIGAGLCLLIYFALFVLRQSVKDEDKKSKIAAVYNVFAYFLMYPAIYLVPAFMGGSHPGGMGPDDEPLMVFKMNPNLRLIFYPAVIGWVLVGIWIAQLRFRIYKIKEMYV